MSLDRNVAVTTIRAKKKPPTLMKKLPRLWPGKWNRMLSLIHTSPRLQQLLQRARLLSIIGIFFYFYLNGLRQSLVTADLQLV